MQEVPVGFDEMLEADVVTGLSKTVLIEFASNRFNDGQVCTASSTKDAKRGLNNGMQTDVVDFWKAEHAFSGKHHDSMNWLVLDQGVTLNSHETGGGYRCIDLDDKDSELPYSWWSNAQSDVNGTFAIPQWVKSEFYNSDGSRYTRPANYYRFTTPQGYNAMSVVELEYLSNGNNWIMIGAFSMAEDQWELSGYIREGLGDHNMVYIRGLRATIYETHGAYQNARVCEFDAIHLVDVSEDVTSFDLTEVREEYDGIMPLGITSSNSISIELDNTHNNYSPFELYNDYGPFMSENNRILVYLHQSTDTWDDGGVPMGEFWSDDWSEKGSDVSVSVGGRDWSKMLQNENNKWTNAWQNVDISVPVRELLAVSGFNPDKVFINAPCSRKYRVMYLNDQTAWDFFGEIGLADRACFGFNREGQFELTRSEIGRIIYYDDFVKDDPASRSLNKSLPTISEDDYRWNSVGFTIEDGLMTTFDDVTVHGRAGIKMAYNTIEVVAKVAVKGTQKIILCARYDASNSLSSIDAVFNPANNTVKIAMYHGTYVLDTANYTYASGDVLKLAVGKKYVRALVNGVEICKSQYVLKNHIIGEAGITVSPDPGGTLTKIDYVLASPVDDVVYDIADDTNLMDGSSKTQIYTNEVVVNISDMDPENYGVKKLWGPEGTTALTYARILNPVTTTTQTTISVEPAPNQENGVIQDNGWPEFDGILFIPTFNGAGKVNGGELIKYKEHNDYSFFGCERGYLNTVPQTWAIDRYIGQALEYDMEFEGAPALHLNPPYATAIDVLGTGIEGNQAQAFIPIFTHNAFGGKLVVANIVNWYTILEGEGRTLYEEENDLDATIGSFIFSISGKIPLGKEKQRVRKTIDAPTVIDKNHQRRYGKNKMEIDNRWIQTENHAKKIAESFIGEYSRPRLILQISRTGTTSVELGDKVSVTYPHMKIQGTDFNVIENRITYDGGIEISQVLREAKPVDA